MNLQKSFPRLKMTSNADCVQVSVRVRPLVRSELERGCSLILKKTPNEAQLEIKGQTHSSIQSCYTFNNVFMPNDPQSSVYDDSVANVIKKVFEGYNVTILAYG